MAIFESYKPGGFHRSKSLTSASHRLLDMRREHESVIHTRYPDGEYVITPPELINGYWNYGLKVTDGRGLVSVTLNPDRKRRLTREMGLKIRRLFQPRFATRSYEVIAEHSGVVIGDRRKTYKVIVFLPEHHGNSEQTPTPIDGTLLTLK